ncbi:MAG: ATP-binding cassette domain-containing protein [Calditrichia bacterium]
MIEFFNVSIKSGNRYILKNINLKIHKGEFVYLIGKTGAGKTTLLRSIYMDLFPTQGNVMVERYSSANIRRKDIPYLRRKVGVIFQDFKLLPDRNVYDNIAFVLKVIGAGRKEIKSRVLSVLTQVGLNHKRYHKFHMLSGGEKQRVAIARALVNEPFVLLADEPTGNLDPEASRDIMELLQRINQQGTAICMATHDYNLIRIAPHRTLLMEGGEIIKEISPDEIKRL